MNPIKYTKTKDGYIFHYSFSDLKNFIKTGKKYGNNGMIITKYEKPITTYRGFGTYEAPLKDIHTLKTYPMPFDKPFNVDDIMNPKLPDWFTYEIGNTRHMDMNTFNKNYNKTFKDLFKRIFINN